MTLSGYEYGGMQWGYGADRQVHGASSPKIGRLSPKTIPLRAGFSFCKSSTPNGRNAFRKLEDSSSSNSRGGEYPLPLGENPDIQPTPTTGGGLSTGSQFLVGQALYNPRKQRDRRLKLDGIGR